MMKLSVSNIAWSSEQDEYVYKLLKEYGFEGLEIAPTRIFQENPYERNDEASEWRQHLKSNYGLCISSMQSIWYGRKEKIFGTQEERHNLISYTRKAIDFAEVIGCKNLVFGCPRNRSITNQTDEILGISFFKKLGDYAKTHNTVIGMEANPAMYNTNYINDTLSAIDLIEKVSSEGFKLNLDIGTMICNQESVSELFGKVNMINHIHISEPGLKAIEKRNIHIELKHVLEDEGYQGYISIEMGKVEDISILEKTMQYVRRIFG